MIEIWNAYWALAAVKAAFFVTWVLPAIAIGIVLVLLWHMFNDRRR